MSEWQSYLLGQIGNEVSEMRSDIKSIKSRLEELTTWLQRIALLIILWAGAILTNVAPDKAGELIATMLKSLK